MSQTNEPSKGSIPSRRQFLQTSTSAVFGAGALASGLNIARSAHAAGSDVIRAALIGCGGRGTGATNDAFNAGRAMKLVAMADAFEDRLQGSLNELKKRHADRIDVPTERQFIGFDAYKQAIDAGVDMVILATPPGFRPLHFPAAVEAGKHVFMEKPLAVDAPGVRAVLAAAEEAKAKSLCVGVGLQRHHQGLYLDTINRLHDGEIGDILLTRVYWNGSGVWVHKRADLEKAAGRKLSEMEYQMRNWYYFNWICGDHITEQHIHNLDVSNWIKGDFPAKANGMGGRQVRTGKDHGEIFDHHFVEFTYPDGTKMMSQCRHIPGCWGSVSEHAHGTKGTARMSDSGGIGRIEGENKWRYRGPNNPKYVTEHADLQAAIREGAPYNEVEYGAKSTMTSILGRMATYSGKEITWDEAINSELSLADVANYHSFEDRPPVSPDASGFYAIPTPGVTKVV